MLTIGLKHTTTTIVKNLNTALAMGSGDLNVLATPAMIALMENAAMNAVAKDLSQGFTSVGISMNVSHLKASPLNETITATATLIAIDQKKLTFSVSASDSNGVIGEGTHVRYIVDRNQFMEKTKSISTTKNSSFEKINS
ncbi:MAG: thioesterase family protein [Bacteroidales bacterium]|nr:thioesterase family protein [Bacteroidales bacterium]